VRKWLGEQTLVAPKYKRQARLENLAIVSLAAVHSRLRAFEV
jgi:hypothetical protein